MYRHRPPYVPSRAQLSSTSAAGSRPTRQQGKHPCRCSRLPATPCSSAQVANQTAVCASMVLFVDAGRLPKQKYNRAKILPPRPREGFKTRVWPNLRPTQRAPAAIPVADVSRGREGSILASCPRACWILLRYLDGQYITASKVLPKCRTTQATACQLLSCTWTAGSAIRTLAYRPHSFLAPTYHLTLWPPATRRHLALALSFACGWVGLGGGLMRQCWTCRSAPQPVYVQVCVLVCRVSLLGECCRRMGARKGKGRARTWPAC